jgi:uncharacterized protein YjbJ (UPF0337 family)
VHSAETRFAPVEAGHAVDASDERTATMDSDQVEGKKKELEGEGQQQWGKAKDKARDVWEDAKDAGEDIADDLRKDDERSASKN